MISLYSQEKDIFLKDIYTSGDFIYRSYGRNDQIGFGGGIEASKDIKKWFGVGANVSYWSDKSVNWNITDPFTGQKYIYESSIKDFSLRTFAQIVLINTKYFDFICRGGLIFAHCNQVYYSGRYNTDYEK